MDIVTMIILEDKLNIPLDVLRYLNEYIKYEELNDNNFKDTIKLWFKNKESCKFKYGHISYWNTKKVTDMSKAFYGKTNFNEYISNWNVSNVKNMNSMFYRTDNFNSDLSRWNVSNVKDMKYMFCCTKSFNSDLSNWNISNVEKTFLMFHDASSFNSDLSPWK